jgi:hypothetical protein
MALTNYERVKRWREKNRALYNLRRRNARKNLPVPVLAEAVTRTSGARPETERECPLSSGEARESNKPDVYCIPSDSRGGQKLPFETKKVGEFRMLVLPEEERPEMPVVKPKVFFNDHGAQISEKVWNQLQEKKRVAAENGYEFDPQ